MVSGSWRICSSQGKLGNDLGGYLGLDKGMPIEYTAIVNNVCFPLWFGLLALDMCQEVDG
jgi:hypothetical protein